MKKLIGVCAMLLLAAACSSGQEDSVTEDPGLYITDKWMLVLGGDDPDQLGLTDTKIEPLNQPDQLSGLDFQRRSQAIDVASRFVVADVTGSGRQIWSAMWPDGNHVKNLSILNRTCTAIDIHAADPQPLPGINNWYKTPVIWSSQEGCPDSVSEDPTGRAVEWVYLHAVGEEFLPVRLGEVPGNALLELGDSQTIPQWAVDELQCVGGGVLYARAEVASAWNVMCNDARSQGIELVAVDALRSAEVQEKRFADAVEFFGNEEAASQFVAQAGDGSCASRHCAGEAIDVLESQVALEWLNTPVRCRNQNVKLADGCVGTSPVARSTTYGFTATLEHSPQHYDFVIPLPSVADTPCGVISGTQTLQIVSTVWECRLSQAGYTLEERQTIVAEALVVAQCASNFDPRYRAFDGAYEAVAHPVTGQTYARSGIFGLPPAWTYAMVGSQVNLDNPGVAASAAVQLWIDEEEAGRNGWEPFGCAVGDEFQNPILPAYGGPEIPQWAIDTATPIGLYEAD